MPLNPEYIRRLRAVQDALDKIPFTVLVWGPAIDAGTPQAQKRRRLREYLEVSLGTGGSVVFSEDDEEELLELRRRGDLTAEFIQLAAADAVILIPESPGALTESALFKEGLRAKCIAFAERRGRQGFASRAYSSLKTEFVEREEWQTCDRVTRLAREFIEELRVEKAIRQRRIRLDWEE